MTTARLGLDLPTTAPDPETDPPIWAQMLLAAFDDIDTQVEVRRDIFDPREAEYAGGLVEGTGDNAGPIQAAIDAAGAVGGGDVIIPAKGGPWYVSHLDPVDNVRLVPRGWMPKIIYLASSNNTRGCIGNTYADDPVSGFQVHGIELDGNKANNTVGCGIQIMGGTNNGVFDCYIHDTPYACALVGAVTAQQTTGAANNRIERCWGHNPAKSGNFWGAFAITGGDDCVLRGNTATTSDHFMAYGCDVEPNSGWTCRRPRVIDNTIIGGTITVTGTVVAPTIMLNRVDSTSSAGTSAAIKVNGATGLVTVAFNPMVIAPNNTSPGLDLENMTAPTSILFVTMNNIWGMGTAQNVYPSNVGILLNNIVGASESFVGWNYIWATAATHASTTAGIKESGTTANIVYGPNRFNSNITVVGSGGPPSVTGSRGGNAALASLLTGLASRGLIVDGTSA